MAQRRREIGVRMALGARPQQILTQFLRLGAGLLTGAWAAGRAMQSVLFGVGALHSGILIGTSIAITAVVLLAVLLPSRRAAHINPIAALRSE